MLSQRRKQMHRPLPQGKNADDVVDGVAKEQLEILSEAIRRTAVRMRIIRTPTVRPVTVKAAAILLLMLLPIHKRINALW